VLVGIDLEIGERVAEFGLADRRLGFVDRSERLAIAAEFADLQVFVTVAVPLIEAGPRVYHLGVVRGVERELRRGCTQLDLCETRPVQSKQCVCNREGDAVTLELLLLEPAIAVLIKPGKLAQTLRQHAVVQTEYDHLLQQRVQKFLDGSECVFDSWQLLECDVEPLQRQVICSTGFQLFEQRLQHRLHIAKLDAT